MKTTTFNVTMASMPTRKPLTLSTVLLIGLFCFAGIKPLCAQNVAINTTGATGNSSAILDLNTGNNGTLGFLPPSLALTTTTTPAPAVAASPGLLVYNTATAGAVPNNVTPGYYYWTGAKWIRLDDNSTTPQYGYNIQSVVGTTDITINNNTPTAMSQMTITFTPVHSVVFLNFSAAGITDESTTKMEAAVFKVLVNYGAGLVAPAVIPAVGTANGYGCTAIAQEYESDDGAKAFGWSCGMVLPIAVTAGTSVTITMYWWAKLGTAGAYSTLENEASSHPETSHRAMIITD